MAARRKIAIIVACIAGLALVGTAVFVASLPASIGGGTVSASSSIAPDDGDLVYSDDFSGNSSGWYEGTSYWAVSSEYTIDGYVVDTPDGAYNDFTLAPYDRSYEQVSVAATGRLDTGAPEDSGFGVVCDRGTGSSELLYEFVVFEDGAWYVGRRTGPDFQGPPAVLHIGSGLYANGQSLRIEAVCATLDDSTTRLALFAGGRALADFSDSEAAIPSGGWSTGLLVSGSVAKQTRVTFTSFELRDLTSGETGAGRTSAGDRTPAVAGSPETSPRPTAAASRAPVSLSGGRVEYDADFAAVDGWPTGNVDPDLTAALSGGGYEVTASRSTRNVIVAPHWTNALSLSVAAVASQTVDSQSAGFSVAGFGVVCTRSTGPTQLTYEFIVRADGSWDVDRIDWPPESTDVVHRISSGSGALESVTREATIVGVCTTFDSTTTQLDFYVDGRLLSSSTDSDPGSSFGGWLGGIDVDGWSSGPHTATLRRFTLTDLRP
jgi:hypothetical protein